MKKQIQDKRIAKLGNYIKNSDIRIETIASQIGVSLGTIYNWIDGRSGVSPLASAPLNAFLLRIENEVAIERQRNIMAITEATK